MLVRIFFILVIFFANFPINYAQDISTAIDYIAKKDYSNAINLLLRLPRSQENSRTIDYYLCESYFLLKDFDNAFRFGEKVLNKKDDFFYKKSLYNVIYSSYMMNYFEKSYNYGIEYLKNVGDSQGVESLVLTIVVNSLQSIGKTDEAREVLEKYKEKYPSLYLSFSKSLDKFKTGEYKKSFYTSENEIFKVYSEIISDIMDSLEKISSKKSIEIEKIKDIFELLELKEELLKVKKYRLMLGE